MAECQDQAADQGNRRDCSSHKPSRFHLGQSVIAFHSLAKPAGEGLPLPWGDLSLGGGYLTTVGCSKNTEKTRSHPTYTDGWVKEVCRGLIVARATRNKDCYFQIPALAAPRGQLVSPLRKSLPAAAIPLGRTKGKAVIHAKQMSRAIGQTVLYRANGLAFEVTVLDVRTVWSRVDLLVQPVAGTGEKWVSFDSCAPVQQPTATVNLEGLAIAGRKENQP